jgi:hypothetical protein
MNRPITSIIRDHVVRGEISTAAADFASLARCLAMAKGSVSEARRLAEDIASPRVIGILEKAEPGMLGSTTPGWGSELADYQQVAQGFIASLRNDGVFDRALPSMVNVPFRTKLAISVSAIVATATAENEEKSVFDLAFTAGEVEPQKVSATVVISDELARLGGANADALIGAELRNAVIAGTDSVFTAALTALTTPVASTGDLLADLAALMAAVGTGSNSQLFFVIEPSQAKVLATLSGLNGAVYPSMTANGGSVAGVNVMTSDGLATGTALLFDARAIAAASENVALSASNEAVVGTIGSPTNASVSLWPQNLLGLRAERWFGFALLRSDGVASLSGVDWTPTSP